jgi:hypothetical protein
MASRMRSKVSDMAGTWRIVSGLVLGLLFPAAVVGLAALAPYANEWFMTPIDGRILAVAWWFLVPLGTTAAVGVSRRMWPGIVVGLASVVGFQWSLALVVASGGLEATSSLASWVSATLSVGLPWAVGMVFGWTLLNQHAVRMDGAQHGDAAGGSPAR